MMPPAERRVRGPAGDRDGKVKDLADFVALWVDRASEVPLFRQIYAGLREAILSGQLPAGTKLLSTRVMTERLRVSRTPVVAAYEQLLSEGYVTGRLGSGTYVAEGLIDVVRVSAPPAKRGPGREAVRLSKAGERARDASPHLPATGHGVFTTGICSTDARTLDTLYQIGRKHLQDLGSHRGYDDPQGRYELRAQIANYLNAARGLLCSPEQIIIVNGSQQAVDLALRVLVDPGEKIWLEDPCYKPASAAARLLGAQICPVPVDEYGIDVRTGIERWPDARFAYVTPSHQYPMGVSLPADRRLELLRWAKEAGAWIIEDDYDCEFRYDGHPLATLYSLDNAESVIYVGSFSKVLLPGLRLGYMVVPPKLRDAFLGARYLSDRHPTIFPQLLVQGFLERGQLAAHIRRMRAIYRETRDILVDRLQSQLGHHLDVAPPAQGMHLVAKLRDASISDIEITERCAAAGIAVRPVSPLFLSAPSFQGLMLGFTGYSIPELLAGCAKLASVLRD